MKAVYQRAFWTLAFLGKPFGGIRPHRLMHWIAHKGFDAVDAASGKRYKARSRWGVLSVHPFYHLDREVIVCGCYDRPLHAFLKLYVKPGMVILDVGANIGEVTIHMAALAGRAGRVYAFEPAPTVLMRLRENIALNGLDDVVQVNAIALSAENGRSPFSFAETGVENQGMGSLVNRANDVVSKETFVDTRTLDDFVTAQGLARVDLIKVDIQGGEIGFVLGGVRTLGEMGPDLVVEVSSADLVAIGKKPADLLRLLEELGYRSFTFDDAGPTRCEVTSATVESIEMSLNVFCTKKAAFKP
jgi:FkbM family methyltransferase